MKTLLILLLSATVLFSAVSPRGNENAAKSNSHRESDAMGLMLQLYGKLQQGMEESSEEAERESVYSLEAEGIWIKAVFNAVKFYFDTSAIKKTERAFMAQLKLKFSQGCPQLNNNNNDDGGGDGAGGARCRLKGVLSDHCDSSWVGFQKEFFIYQNEPVSFDVTEMIKRWKERRQTKGCISLTLMHSHDRSSAKLVRSLMNSLMYDHRPVLLIYTQDDSPEEENSNFLYDSSIINIDSSRHDIQARQINTRHRTLAAGKCRRVKFYVEFEKLGLKGRIVAPRGMNINYCTGQCIFPLSSNTNHTLHAEVQALLHLMNHGTVPSVCCTPIKYQPIVLLYYTENHTLTLRIFNKLSVKKCGCM